MAEMTASQGAGAVGGVGSILSFIGNMKAGSAAKTAGQRSKAAADYQAVQLDQNAGQAIAASQRAAMDERRRTALLISRGIAVAAASGGGVTDPTVGKLLEDIAGEGAYRASVDLYQGEERARSMRMAADAKRFEGDVAAEGGADRESAYTMAGLGGLASSGASLYGKYGMGGPKKFNVGTTDSYGNATAVGWD